MSIGDRLDQARPRRRRRTWARSCSRPSIERSTGRRLTVVEIGRRAAVAAGTRASPSPRDHARMVEVDVDHGLALARRTAGRRRPIENGPRRWMRRDVARVPRRRRRGTGSRRDRGRAGPPTAEPPSGSSRGTGSDIRAGAPRTRSGRHGVWLTASPKRRAVAAGTTRRSAWSTLLSKHDVGHGTRFASGPVDDAVDGRLRSGNSSAKTNRAADKRRPCRSADLERDQNVDARPSRKRGFSSWANHRVALVAAVGPHGLARQVDAFERHRDVVGDVVADVEVERAEGRR